ncbi:nucleoside hydrolase [Sphingomonas aurantiaca]|uniref:nucleoside hydrolase n=1 Tax=Sphingomonas aurantiaca TaxID=185949 RepID=UPI003A5C1440
MRRVFRFGVGWALILALAVPVAASSGRDAPTKRLVLIDDDVVGLSGAPALLLQAPDVEVLGITTTSGSVWRDTATAYALRTVEIVGRTDVPVVPGATYPLLNNEAATARWEALYGRLEFKGPWTAPAPGVRAGRKRGRRRPRSSRACRSAIPSPNPAARSPRRSSSGWCGRTRTRSRCSRLGR